MPNFLPFALIFTSWFGSMAIAVLPFALFSDQSAFLKWLTMAAVPVLFVIAFPLITGSLSRFAQKGIIRGTFPREAMHPVYLMRRIYGACWTQLYYFKPVYSVVLAIPLFRKVVLRLFGYKASTDFVVYPDTWIRDLPILKVGSGAYLSNRATVATNICLSDGNIMVDSVKVEEKALIGHLAMVAPGSKFGLKCQVGINCAVGIRAILKEGANVKPSTSLNHGAIIGLNAEIGPMSFIGLRAEIGDGVVVPAGASIPAGAILKTQDEVNKYHSSETQRLAEHKDLVAQIVQKHAPHAS